MAPSITAFLLPLVVYLLTLAPTVFGLDSAELTTAAATGGLTRATGYPLYLSIGWLWSKLPFGDVGYRMNLLSAVSAAITLLLCERILLRMGVRPVARLAAVGMLGFSKYFWQLALIAEVYTLQTAIVGALILSLLAWSEKTTALRLGLVGLTLGLGLSHHMSTVLLFPGVIVFLLVSTSRRSLTPKSLSMLVIGGILGLAFYLYLPLRYHAAPAFNYAGFYDGTGIFHADALDTLPGVWHLVSGASFAPMMFGYPPVEIGWEGWKFLVLLTGSFLAVGIGPGLLGVWQVFRRQLTVGLLLSLMFIAHALFYINYRAVDKELMYLPAYLIWALWIGIGFELILAWNDRVPLSADPTATKPLNLASLVLQCVMLGAVVVALALNWRLVDLSHDRTARRTGEEILQTLPPNSLYFGYWGSVPVVQYLQLVEGQRPDVQAVNRFLISNESLVEWIVREAPDRPVFIDSLPQELPDHIQPHPEGSIIRLSSVNPDFHGSGVLPLVLYHFPA